MPVNLRNRSFLKELDYTPAEWRFLLDLATELKRARYAGTEVPRLSGRNIARIFERPAPSTGCAFEVAAHDQGAHITHLQPPGARLGHQESTEDTARVLSRYYDGMEYRGYSHRDVETLGHYAGVPVWNGLTDEWNPIQTLCDTLTMREHSVKHVGEIAFAFCGNALGGTGNSLLVTGAMMGMDVRMVAPKACWNRDDVIKEARRIAEGTGARILHTEDVAEGVPGVDFLYTDAWLSMDDSREAWAQRIALLGPYRITIDVVRATGNPAVKFMHCLPALRRTRVGAEISQHTGTTALEMTDEVFESRHSIVFDQAENMMHTVKAVMVATLGG
jgi:ornithine carbamoyltransferase